MKRYLFAVFASSIFGSCKSKLPTLTEAEVRNVINRFDDGWDHKNMNEVDSVLAPAYVYFTRSGGTF